MNWRPWATRTCGTTSRERRRGSRPGCPWRAEADGSEDGVDERAGRGERSPQRSSRAQVRLACRLSQSSLKVPVLRASHVALTASEPHGFCRSRKTSVTTSRKELRVALPWTFTLTSCPTCRKGRKSVGGGPQLAVLLHRCRTKPPGVGPGGFSFLTICKDFSSGRCWVRTSVLCRVNSVRWFARGSWSLQKACK